MTINCLQLSKATVLGEWCLVLPADSPGQVNLIFISNKKMIHRQGDLADLEEEHRAEERSFTEKIYDPLS